MKKTKRSSPRHATAVPAKTVTFSLPIGEAKQVALAGTFNDWNPESSPLHLNGNQCWEKELALPPGTHEYQFVVDGRWMADPQAPEYVPNPFGGINSVVRVAAGA